jgi:hypothetical protein
MYSRIQSKILIYILNKINDHFYDTQFCFIESMYSIEGGYFENIYLSRIDKRTKVIL